MEEECETDRKWEEYPAAQQVEQMQEMLDLALEANQLLEERAEENAEVQSCSFCLMLCPSLLIVVIRQA